MLVALSPGASWLLIGGWLLAVVLIVLFFMGASLVSGAVMGMQATEPPIVHLYGGIYDHEVRGDFHDPVRDHEWCPDCNARLRRAFNDLADLDLGPRDADALMAAIHRELES
jgi:hypothetical protein